MGTSAKLCRIAVPGRQPAGPGTASRWIPAWVARRAPGGGHRGVPVIAWSGPDLGWPARRVSGHAGLRPGGGRSHRSRRSWGRGTETAAGWEAGPVPVTNQGRQDYSLNSPPGIVSCVTGSGVLPRTRGRRVCDSRNLSGPCVTGRPPPRQGAAAPGAAGRVGPGSALGPGARRAPTCAGARSAGFMRSLVAGAGQEGQELADGAFPAAGLGERQVGLDLVAVAAAVLVLDDVPGPGEVGDDAVGGASVTPVLAAMSRSRTPGSWAMHSSTRAWLVRELQSVTSANYHRSFLEIYC